VTKRRKMRLLAATAGLPVAAGLSVAGLQSANAANPAARACQKVVIETGSGDGAGTGNDVYIDALDGNQARQVKLDGPGNNFQADSRDEFSVCAPQQVHAYSGGSKVGLTLKFRAGADPLDGWQVRAIEVDGKRFDCYDAWLQPREALYCGA
jgi:hypothetical protein